MNAFLSGNHAESNSQLPWSTSNEDLVELFQTTGTVEYAEALSEGGRSKGCGIVQFNSNEEAETAIAKFRTSKLEPGITLLNYPLGCTEGYSYGGRPLALEVCCVLLCAMVNSDYRLISTTLATATSSLSLLALKRLRLVHQPVATTLKQVTSR